MHSDHTPLSEQDGARLRACPCRMGVAWVSQSHIRNDKAQFLVTTAPTCPSQFSFHKRAEDTARAAVSRRRRGFVWLERGLAATCIFGTRGGDQPRGHSRAQALGTDAQTRKHMGLVKSREASASL